jgi:hypothetical protein
MNFAKNTKINTSSVFLTVKVAVTESFTMIKQPGIEKSAADLVAQGNLTRFQEQYGDMFVRGLVTGGLYIGVMQIETTGGTDKQNVKGHLSAAYGLFGKAQADFNREIMRILSGRSFYVTGYVEGGALSTPRSPEELLNSVSNWPTTVKGNAVPYGALLSPYSILPLPNPPTFVNIQHQKDVLAQCAQIRNDDLTALADIHYIKSKPQEFVDVGNYQLDQLQNELNQDLNTVTKAAQDALNNPKDASLPTNLLHPPPVRLPQRVDEVAGFPSVYKLENFESKQRIYSNSDGRFGTVRGDDYSDQYWKLIGGTGAYSGYYSLRTSSRSNGFIPILTDASEPFVGMITRTSIGRFQRLRHGK